MELKKYFAPNNNLGDAIREFFKGEIGLDLNTRTKKSLAVGGFISDRQEILNEIHSLFFAGQLTPKTFEEENNRENFEDIEKSLEEEKYKTILVFGIDLKNGTPSKTILKQITRKLNVRSKGAPVVVIFRSGQWLSFANIERQKYKQTWREGEKPGMVSLLKDICIEKPHSAHKRILRSLSLKAMAEYDRKDHISTFDQLHKGWQRVFSTSILNEEFYRDYQKLSVQIIRAIHPAQVENKLKAHQGALNLLNRLMFVYFIQKKGWLMGNPEFIYHFWKDYLNQKEDEQKDCVDFHEKWLNKLFFTAFNGKAYQDKDIFRIFPEKYKGAILEFPFLNGGLFTKTDEDDFLLDDNLFFDVFLFFQSYIFTISEDTADEINLEINPELLGKMYEGMINATDLDDVDAENGIVYTERPEINFMTRRSFVEVFHKKLPNGKYSREFLYHFCFDKPDAKLELLRKYKVNAEEIRQVILSITALDPACGSGSMLIGVIQLQLELLKCLYEYQNSGKCLSPREEFLQKKQIISESIYGVDIKEWAVRIAELRFWLYMIADAEFTTEELVKEPLLPNLDFKLRQGDSLIQEIGNLDFSLKGLFKGKKRNAGATRKLNEFIKKKKEFIANNIQSKTSFKKLKEEELFVFRTFIDELLFENTQRIKQLEKGDGQQKIFDEPQAGNIFQSQIDLLKVENQQLKKVKESIKDKGRLPFSYDIDFMEIFITSDDPGFDLVIGNPPYVQQEDIIPAHDALELERLMLLENKEEKAELAKAFKEKLSQKVFKTYPFLSTTAKVDEIDEEGNFVLTTNGKKKQKTIEIYGKKVPGQSDLYVYFQLLCPSLLNTQGVFCFIISSSWLDTRFGSFIQHFLLKHTDLYSIYDSNVRSFNASVNTIIYLHSSVKNSNLTANQYKTLLPENRSLKFIYNKINYTEIAYAPILLEQESCAKNTYKDFYRVILKNQNELFSESYNQETFSYTSGSWGSKYLKAPEIYFTILGNGGEKFSPFAEIATIRRGFTSGANDFYYLPSRFFDLKEKENSWELKPKHDNIPDNIEINKDDLKPLFFSLKEAEMPELSNNSYKKYFFSSIKEPAKLDKSKKYVYWGEQQGFNQRPTCKNRNPHWYSLGDGFLPAQFIIPSKVGERFMLMNNRTQKILEDKKQYGVLVEDEYIQEVLFVYCNSTLYRFLVEQLSPQLTGAQAISDITTAVYKSSPVLISLKELPSDDTLTSFKNRKQESVFIELGFDKTKPIRNQMPNPLTDRKVIDDVVFNELGLNEEERKEVYWATAEIVKDRLDKAASR